MSKCKIKYKGKVYDSISALARAYGKDARMINSRLHNGWSVKNAVEAEPYEMYLFMSKSVVYKGKKYNSRAALYREMKSYLRKVCHRRPNTRLETFLNTINTKGVEEAVERMISAKYARLHGRNLKGTSKQIGGADNLVCQRMKKLGWSYDKAVNTPKDTVHVARPVMYKGKTYRSMSECYRKVKPKMSIITFFDLIKKNGYIVR